MTSEKRPSDSVSPSETSEPCPSCGAVGGCRFGAKCDPPDVSRRCPGLSERAPLTHVAVRDSHGAVWSLPRPHRHHHVLEMMHAHGAKQDKDEPDSRQGFLDSHGHYLTRKQARVNAELHDQLKGGKTIASILTSEDLW